MSASLTPVDTAELTSDATFTDALQRVSFQPGILLGAEAMDAEQAYHLRRLTRHQRWLIGPGTVFGMRVDSMLPLSNITWATGTVTATAATAHGFSIGDTRQITIAGALPAGYNGTFTCTITTPVQFTWPLAANPGPATLFGSYSDDADVRLIVSPGYGIDGLGREVLVTETYAVSLRDWLLANNTSAAVASAYAAGTLYLRVTVRSSALSASLQPVVAELFDSGLDPVVPARVQDSFQLELLADLKKVGDTPAAPLATWSPTLTTPTAANLQGLGTAREQAMLTGLNTSNPGLAADLALQAWLLGQPLPPFDDSPGNLDNLVESSRLLLASVHVSLATIATPPTVAGTTVNNLVRPFVRANALLAAMSLP